jgi:hypothetical protein
MFVVGGLLDIAVRERGGTEKEVKPPFANSIWRDTMPMINSIRYFFDKIFDRVCWLVIVQPDRERFGVTPSKLSWTMAKHYARMYNGTIVHAEDENSRRARPAASIPRGNGTPCGCLEAHA